MFKKNPVVKVEREVTTIAKLPSFSEYYRDDPKTLLNTANSLAVMKHLVGGTRNDYEAVTHTQTEHPMTLGQFCKLTHFFRPFREKSSLHETLELFIYLDGVSRTDRGKSLISHLPVEYCEDKARDFLSASIAKYGFIPEIRNTSLGISKDLERAIAYRLFITRQAPGHTIEFTKEVKLVAQAGTICDIAGLAADIDTLGASSTLTSGMVEQINCYIDGIESGDFKAEEQLCSLTID